MARRNALQLVHPLQLTHLFLAAQVVPGSVHYLAFIPDPAGHDMNMFMALIPMLERYVLVLLKAHSRHVSIHSLAPLVIAQGLSVL